MTARSVSFDNVFIIVCINIIRIVVLKIAIPLVRIHHTKGIIKSITIYFTMNFWPFSMTTPR